MANVFIIHGSYGSPEENWLPWIKTELERLDCTVFVPRFPTPKNQNLENWTKIFHNHKLDAESIVIGHSLGVAFLLNILEKLDNPIRAAFFVSGFVGNLDNPEFDDVNKTFTNKKFNWEKLRGNCRKYHIFYSDNDPYVPIEKAEELANKLKTNIILVKNAGHFNSSAGYDKFELLLKKIKQGL